MKIGIFGGSFNPVHSEHIKTIIKTIEYLKLDKMIVVPAKIPPHKKNEKLASGLDRASMLSIALKNVKNCEVSHFELDSESISYTYLTVQHFKQLYKDAELFFLVGTDMLADFVTWKEPEKILENCTLFVTPREGEDTKEAEEKFIKKFNKNPIISPFIGGKVSSTKLKAYYKLNLNTDKFLDKEVKYYIINNDLYAQDKYYKYIAEHLPEKRRIHTANVIALASNYALRLSVDKEKAILSALLHDCAKYDKAEAYPNFCLPKCSTPPIEHQFLGSFVAENVLGVKDTEILSSIRYHSTGKADMTSLEKIIFLADLLEDDRNFDGVEMLREKVNENFENGFKIAVKELWKFLLSDGNPICELTKQCYEFYNDK